MRVAVVHDWLFSMRGGEKCLDEILELFPDADVYALFHRPGRLTAQIESRLKATSIGSNLPGVENYYRYLLPLFPWFTKNLSEKLLAAHKGEAYDLVISVSHCAAKNISVPKGVSHVCYCLTPMRYAYDQFEAYFGRSPVKPIIRFVTDKLAHWDKAHSSGVTAFLAISDFVKARIERLYRRKAEVVYPPVRTEWIPVDRTPEKKGFFLCVSALVPYKNIEAVVEAFSSLREPLIVVGRGPEEARLKRIAGGNVSFIDYLPAGELAKLYAQARALVFAAVEDFGMIPVEVQAAGTPVIALAEGGSLETVSLTGAGKTGEQISEPTPKEIAAAVERFMQSASEFSRESCFKQAERFSVSRFRASFIGFLSSNNLLKESGRERVRAVES